jgi:hypothetical protein
VRKQNGPDTQKEGEEEMTIVIQEIPAKRLEWKEVDGFHTWDGALKLEEDGWRLPLTRELVELSESKLIPYETYYWSASKCDIDKGAWVVYLPSGRVDVAMRRDTYQVLLVRELSQEEPGHGSI